MSLFLFVSARGTQPSRPAGEVWCYCQVPGRGEGETGEGTAGTREEGERVPGGDGKGEGVCVGWVRDIT